MQSASPHLIAFTFAAAFGSTLYASRSLLEQSLRLEALRMNVGNMRTVTKPTPEWNLPLANSANVRFTPVQKGTVLGMADDGSYLGISDYRAIPPVSYDGKSTNFYRYFIQYADGSRHEFIKNRDVMLQMLANGNVVCIDAPNQLPNKITIIRRGKGIEEKLMDDQTAIGDHFLSDGNIFPSGYQGNEWIDIRNGKRIKAGSFSQIKMNEDGKMIAINDKKVCIGTLEKSQTLYESSRNEYFRDPQLSNGENPRMLICISKLWSQSTSIYEVKPTGLSKIDTPKMNSPICISISSDGDLLFIDNRESIFLRHQYQWSNLTDLHGIRAIQVGQYYGTTAHRTRTVFENGTTLINSMRDGENWIYRLEVLK